MTVSQRVSLFIGLFLVFSPAIVAETESIPPETAPTILSEISFKATVSNVSFGVSITESKEGIYLNDFLEPPAEGVQDLTGHELKTPITEKEYNELWNLIRLKVNIWQYQAPVSDAPAGDGAPYWHFVFHQKDQLKEMTLRDSLNNYPEMQKIVQILTAFSAVKFQK